MATRRLLVLPALLLAACGGGPPGPVRVAVLSDAQAGAYRLMPVTLTTLDSLTRLSGEAATMLGGARIVIDPQELGDAQSAGQLNTVADVARIVTKDAGHPVTAQFTPGTVGDEASVLIPDDFAALGMVTLYHHLEAARLEALKLGMPASCLVSIKAYYDAYFEEVQGLDSKPETDNAMWFPLLQSFLVLPFGQYRQVPLAMNPGVIAHEYDHGIWGCIIEHAQPLPPLETSLDEVSANYFHGLNEGLADFFGGEVTGDSDFIEKSIPGISVDRDMAVDRNYTTAMDQDATNGGGYDPYGLGSVIASSLWKIRGDSADPDAVGRTVIDSMSRLRDRVTQIVAGGRSFTPTDYLEVLAAAFKADDAADAPEACSVLSQRFAILGPIPGCPTIP